MGGDVGWKTLVEPPILSLNLMHFTLNFFEVTYGPAKSSPCTE